MHWRRTVAVTALIAVAPVAAACGSGQEPGDGSSTRAPASSGPVAPPVATGEPQEPVDNDEMGVSAEECPLIGVPAVPVCGPDAQSSLAAPGGQTVRYTDGLEYTLLSVRDLKDNKLGWKVPASDTLVRVDLEVKNGSKQPVRLDGVNIYFRAQYGDARYDAESAGYAGDTRTGMDPEPNRIAAGTTLRLWMTFRVPKDQLDTLSVEPSQWINPHLPFSFTDLAAILK
jgi:hypothetical protein